MIDKPSGTVRVVWYGGDRFDIKIRDHRVRADQPTDAGGSDTGPTPVELFVAGLAACTAHYARRYLHRRDLPMGVTVTARYEMDPRPARVARVELVVKAPGLPENLRDSFTAVIEHCTVHNSLRVPPRVDFRVVTAESAAQNATAG
ncbi:OsmC family protein [Planobispora siamensis]|uniref:OsmC-like protein n=1 Tax=Planobispora siamensis TaxID=936338 RepID=A0A8J3SM86_9ACTN|nr:OsmC family protein [Planobispora siamensis]GIH95790.1 hypothetical protein Psi01_64200 [Planobispora siamensis]